MHFVGKPIVVFLRHGANDTPYGRFVWMIHVLIWPLMVDANIHELRMSQALALLIME
jgi:hypothetical protein